MSKTIDVSGLPDPVVRGVQQLVETMRDQLARQPREGAPPERSAERLAILENWIRTRPTSRVIADDSRESIYAGRGE